MDAHFPGRPPRATGAALALAVSLWAAAARAGAADEETFVDRAGVRQPFAPVYDAWFGSERRPVRVERALGEGGAFMAAGLAYYWLDPLANSVDWDNPSLADRVNGRALRFDTNLNTTNFFLHPGAGALIYGFARDDGLAIPAALGVAGAASLVWEIGLEWREKPSINDFVFSTIGGAAFGEFGYHLGEYLNSSPRRTLAQEIAADVFGFARRFHAALDHDAPPRATLPPDDLGLSSAYAHDFRARYELASIANDGGDRGALHRIAVDAVIVDVPGFLREGTFAVGFARGSFSELHLRLGAGATGLDEVDLQTRATFVGHYAQSFARDDDGVLRGHAGLLGAGSGLRFDAMRLLGRHDQLSTVHLFGPQAQIWAADGDVRARAGVEAYPEFGAIDSIAWPAFVGTYSEAGTKFVLQKQGYTFDYGVWGRLRGAIDVGPFALEGAAAYGRYESIEGLDRYQERVTYDVHATESVLELDADARVRLGLAALGVGAARRERSSVLGPVRAHRVDRELRASLGVVF